MLIVVSALSGMTDKLKAICDEYSRDGHADAQRCRAVADEIVARHRAMFAELGLTDTRGIESWLARLDAAARRPASRRGRTDLAGRSARARRTDVVDARRRLSQHARPRDALARRARAPARDAAAEPERMGSLSLGVGADRARRSLDLASADARRAVRHAGLHGAQRGRRDRDPRPRRLRYVGELLRCAAAAEKVEIWTDVAGMFSANPRQVPNARLLLAPRLRGGAGNRDDRRQGAASALHQPRARGRACRSRSGTRTIPTSPARRSARARAMPRRASRRSPRAAASR